MAYRKFTIDIEKFLAKAKEMDRIRIWKREVNGEIIEKELIDLVIEDYAQPTQYNKTIGIFFDKKREEYSMKPEELPNLRLCEGTIHYTYKEKQAMGLPTTSYQAQNTSEQLQASQQSASIQEDNLPF